MHPAHLLEIKQRVLTSEVAAVKTHIERIRRTDDPAKISALLERMNDL